MNLYMILELSHFLLEVQEIKFPYDRSYKWLLFVKSLAGKKRLPSLLPMIIIDLTSTANLSLDLAVRARTDNIILVSVRLRLTIRVT